MKPVLKAPVLVLMLLLLSTGCRTTADLPPPPTGHDIPSLGYRIPGAGGDPDSYLVGSVHLLPKTAEPIVNQYRRLLSTTDTLVIEVEPKLSFGLLMATVRLGFYPDGESIDDHVSEDLAVRLEERAASLDLENHRQMRPWLLATSLSVGAASDVGIEADLGLEVSLLKDANAWFSGLSVVELESAVEQIELLAAMPEELALHWLEQALTQEPTVATSTSQLVDAWICGDGESLLNAASEQGDGTEPDPAVEQWNESFIQDRNRRMLEGIEVLLQDGRSHFITVGSLHVIGQDGLVQLLQERGYSLEPITLKASSELAARCSGPPQPNEGVVSQP